MSEGSRPVSVSLLTGGRDPHYAMGLLAGLLGKPIDVDFVASHDMRSRKTARRAALRYVDLYAAPGRGKVGRLASVLRTYLAICKYALTTRSRIFHVLWYYKVEPFDNTLLTRFFRALGKRIVLTVHNVNRGERDGHDGLLNRVSLKYLYRSVDHIFVHTQQSKAQLCGDFGVDEAKVTVIPFGVNIFTGHTALTPAEARARLDIGPRDKALLFFGNIAPYKGLDTLIDALALVPDCRLIIAGPVKKGCEAHWHELEQAIAAKGLESRVRKDVKFIPEEDVEVYFKAAHATVLPYKNISQSGVLFLSFGFGLPVIVSDADGLPEAVDQGINGLVFRSGDAADLARAIREYFAAPAFSDVDGGRAAIIDRLERQHSWDSVAETTVMVYDRLLAQPHALESAVVR